MLKTGHSVTRPGRQHGDEPVTISVPEELETIPGNVQKPQEVDFYSREYPLESMMVEATADSEWMHSASSSGSVVEYKMLDRLNRPLLEAHKVSGEIEPTAEPVPGMDVTEEIRAKAKELGFGEVGFTRFDRRYVLKYKKDFVKFPQAICLAFEQDYEPTQTAPDIVAEGPHFATYRIMGAVALDLADYIRSLGYHAQVHNPIGDSAVYIPMFVEAGLGQLGANGQLLSPHFGSRARLMVITTDAQVTYDRPIDYGIPAFCAICQVCVNRCPGRALLREKIWWRGAEKYKVIYRRCLPVMARYDGCGACMKVCPVQRYGMMAVMDHYAATGQVLGKGTHLLEGYSISDMGYFGPGELPSFGNEFFRFRHGKSEDLLFEDLKERIKGDEVPNNADGHAILYEFKEKVEKYVKTAAADIPPTPR